MYIVFLQELQAIKCFKLNLTIQLAPTGDIVAMFQWVVLLVASIKDGHV